MYTPEIEYDIPFADYPPRFEDVRDRVQSAINAIAALDLQLEVKDKHMNEARNLFMSEKTPPDSALAVPETVVHLHNMLTAYDHMVVKSAAQMRNYVTNKLLEETASPTASIRIRALELLGKISDVGLFTEKTEVTLRHRPTAELEQMLREKLERVITGSAEVIPPPPIVENAVEISPDDLEMSDDVSKLRITHAD